MPDKMVCNMYRLCYGCDRHLIYGYMLQETCFASGKTVTRKVSTTSVKSLPNKSMAQAVTVTRSQSSEPNKPPAPPTNELSPWHVTTVNADGVPQQKRLCMTTEL